jgi:hypothetical protein
VHYNKTFRYFDQIDEVVFDYKGTEALVTFIPNLLKQKQKALINLANVNIEEVLEYLFLLQQVYENFTVQIKWDQRDWIPTFEENNIKFMFAEYVNNMDQVATFAQYNITDIYICESLGFQLDKLQGLRRKGIAIRIFPDVAQCNMEFKDNIPDIQKFFVRPEGLDEYEDYIDTVEIYCCDRTISATYEIYKQRAWAGYLEDLISSFSDDFSIHNNTILPFFDKVRISCGKFCATGDCHFCDRYKNLAPHLEESKTLYLRDPDPIIKIDKEKYEKLLKELKERKYNEHSNQEDMLFE